MNKGLNEITERGVLRVSRDRGLKFMFELQFSFYFILKEEQNKKENSKYDL